MSDNDWKKRLNMVYSTNPDFQYEDIQESVQECLPPSRQNIRISLDKRNRGGKKVTIVADFKGDEQSMKDLCKYLKTKCGVGGSVKDGEIIIQGDFRVKIKDILTTDGYKARVI